MKNKSAIYFMSTCALMAALMCALGPLSVPIGPVPITLVNLVIYLSVLLLGAKGASVSTLVYLLLGAVGLPVFSGFQGGLAKLVGPTGGYLVGYLIVAFLGGLAAEKTKYNTFFSIVGMLVGTAILYTLGTVWFVYQTGSEWVHALSLCVYPFIPFDIGKIVLASFVGKLIRSALIKSKLLPTQDKE